MAWDPAILPQPIKSYYRVDREVDEVSNVAWGIDEPIHMFIEFADSLIIAPGHQILLLDLVLGNYVGVSASRLHWVM